MILLIQKQIRTYQADIEKLEELLAETKSGHDSEVGPQIVTVLCYTQHLYKTSLSGHHITTA